MISLWYRVTRRRYPDDAVGGARDDHVEGVPLARLAEGGAQHLRRALAAARVHAAQRRAVDGPHVQPAAAARRDVALHTPRASVIYY